MLTKTTKQAIVWGGLLILIGLLLLVNQFVELSPWVWVLVLAVAGLGAFGLYLAARSDLAMLLAPFEEDKDTVPVYLRCDEEVPYGFVLKVMAAVEVEGFLNLSLVTDQPAPGDETP